MPRASWLIRLVERYQAALKRMATGSVAQCGVGACVHLSWSVSAAHVHW